MPFSWLIVPTKGIVKFHEVCIEPLAESESKNLVVQHIQAVRESLGVEPGVLASGRKEDGADTEDMWSSHLDALGDRLNQDKSGFLRMVNR